MAQFVRLVPHVLKLSVLCSDHWFDSCKWPFAACHPLSLPPFLSDCQLLLSNKGKKSQKIIWKKCTPWLEYFHTFNRPPLHQRVFSNGKPYTSLSKLGVSGFSKSMIQYDFWFWGHDSIQFLDLNILFYFVLTVIPLVDYWVLNCPDQQIFGFMPWKLSFTFLKFFFKQICIYMYQVWYNRLVSSGTCRMAQIGEGEEKDKCC